MRGIFTRLNHKQLGRKLCAGVLAAALGVGAVPGAGSGMAVLAEEGDAAAMGRYLETDVVLPEEIIIMDVISTQDGTLRILGNNMEGAMAMWDSTDGGDTWEQSGVLPEEYTNTYFMSSVLNPQGGGAGVTMEEKEDSDSQDPANMYNYYFVSFDSQGAAEKTLLGDDLNYAMLQFTQSGELVAKTYNDGTVLLEPDTGAIESVITASTGDTIGVCGETLLLFTDSEVQLYDIQTGEPISRDDALNETLYANGESYMNWSSIGNVIVFAQDDEERLYYCSKNGIFSHILGGSVVEQVVDGTLTSLAEPDMTLMGMAFLDQSFYVAYYSSGGSGLRKYEYDESISSVPEKELRIWSLEDNDAVRQAVSVFQKLYPDTYVNFSVGMNGEDGVTAADALRTLNTDILAGNGPDILVLDDMPVETYTEKGILADLSELAAKVEESDGLLTNVTEAYRSEDMLPAIPMMFSIEMAVGDPELLEGLDGLDSLTELASQEGTLDPFSMINIAEVLYPVCAGSWKNEDNTIDQEKLAEFVNAAKAIYDACGEDDTSQYITWSDLGSAVDDGLAMGILNLYTGDSQVELGALGDIISYSGLTTVNHINGDCAFRLLSMQQSNVFLPSCILGVLSTARETERALEFVEYMLSEEGQNQKAGVGFPVNQKSFDTLLTVPQWDEGGGFGVYSSDGDGQYVELNYEWPTDEDMEQLREMAEQVSVCADTEQVQHDTVIEQVTRCLNGEISTDEAVNAIIQSINLYLAE